MPSRGRPGWKGSPNHPQGRPLPKKRGPKRKPNWEPVFFEAFLKTGHQGKACDAAGISRTEVYQRRKRDEQFATAYDQALEVAGDMLEDAAKTRAVDGVDEPVFYQGDVCGHVTKYSDALLMFLLRGAKPEKYRDRVEVHGPTLDAAIETLIRQLKGESHEEGPVRSSEEGSGKVPVDQG